MMTTLAPIICGYIFISFFIFLSLSGDSFGRDNLEKYHHWILWWPIGLLKWAVKSLWAMLSRW